MGIRQAGLSLLLTIWLISGMTASPVLAQSTSGIEHNLRMWAPIYLNAPIYKRVQGYLEVNPRMDDGMRAWNQLLIRPGVGLQLRRNVFIHTGYAWIKNFQPDFLQENRIWEQLIVTNKIFKLEILNRTRLEQRLIERLPGSSHRLRHMVRLSHPIGKSDFYLATFEELFVNLNNLKGGPSQGIDQNRFFAGVGRKMGKNFRVECGYQLQYINRTDVFDQGNHTILFNIYGLW